MNHNRASELLKKLIAVPSVSRQEDGTASLLMDELSVMGLSPRRYRNNVWAVGPFDSSRPTLLLNSHHDTVRPVSGWLHQPHEPVVDGDRIYGLGSNDAGASAVCLVEAFHALRHENLPFNMVLAITAEEEVGGENGMRAFLPMLKDEGVMPDMAIVGEPTCMEPAIAERGLVVLDCVAHGKSGHAARGEGINAIYIALRDIERLRSFTFPSVSRELGPVTLNTTMIQAGTAHNVIPDTCTFTVDIRTTDAYSNEETVEAVREMLESDVTPRSTRIRASVIERSHPLVLAAVECGGEPFSSPTTSDMSLLHDIPSLKIGPGNSSRSHTADEYITFDELRQGAEGYVSLIRNLAKIMQL